MRNPKRDTSQNRKGEDDKDGYPPELCRTASGIPYYEIIKSYDRLLDAADGAPDFFDPDLIYRGPD